MIIANSSREFICMPKLKRCKQNDCNEYLLILRNNYTKEVWLFKVSDFRYTQVRYNIDMRFPKEFETGEYTYYLVSFDELITTEISTNFPSKTKFTADKGAVTFNGMFIIANGMLLMTNRMKAELTVGDDSLLFKGKKLVANHITSDDRPYADISTGIDIIATGLLKYEPVEPICCDSGYDGKEYDHYIQYKG